METVNFISINCFEGPVRVEQPGQLLGRKQEAELHLVEKKAMQGGCSLNHALRQNILCKGSL